MALQKQTANINFAQGLDTKTDPFQVQAGRFLALSNSIFGKNGRLQKRNGNQRLADLPDSTSTLVSTFNGDLTAIGTSLNAYSSSSKSWVNKGTVQPVQLDVLSLIRNNTNQSQADSAISNGFVCTVYTDQDPSSLSSKIYRYAVADVATGQNIVAPTTITAADATLGTPKVYVLGNYFIILFTNLVTATYHLKYIAVSSTTPVAVTASSDISTSYTPSATVNFDAVTMGNALYVAWNGAASSGVKMAYLTSTLVVSSTVTVDNAHVATLMSVCADTTNQMIWAFYYNSGTSKAYVFAVTPQLATILAATEVVTASAVLNVTITALAGTATILYELSNNYTYDAAIPSHFIRKKTVTQAGSVGSASVILRSVGLASKSVRVGSTIYALYAYQSTYQPTYFLADSSGNVVAKLAYQNGGGYLTTGLPTLTGSGTTLYVPYLVKDLIEAVNKGTNVTAGTQTAGIYAQTGINLATFEIGGDMISAEIGSNLNLSGGFLWSYDGYAPVEQGFHLYPDNVEVLGVITTGSLIAQKYYYVSVYEWADNQGNIFRSAPSIPVTYTIATAPASFTGNRTSGSAIITSVSSTANLQVGQAISGTGIPAATYILSIDSSTQITMSANATSGTATSTTITPTTLSSLTVNVPTLRLTYKTANPVKIAIYRWSTAQQVYYKVTSVNSPVLNSTTTDSIAFTDSSSDATILGNQILYTTGGVLENIAAPAVKTIALFDDRLWALSAEDGNLLLFSKQVIENTPVEMSDLLTMYVAPTTAAQGPTGKGKCLSAMDDKLILFKKDAMYYVNGRGPDNTGANNQYGNPTLISSTVGCENQKSIVFTPNGLMFQSDKGIWLLGRDLSTQYIGAAVEAYNSYEVLSALCVPGTNQVRFTLSNGVTLMYDYYYGQWGTFAGVNAVSSTLFQSLHTYITSAGKVYQENPGSYVDGSNPVLMSFKTSWFNLAGLQGYQRAYFFYLLANFLSPHKLQVQIAYDYNPAPSQTVVISPDNYSGTYGSVTPYGSQSTYGGVSALEQWRVFFQQQRCEAFQITITEIFDPSEGTAPGAGFTMSGLDLVFGTKKGYPNIASTKSTG